MSRRRSRDEDRGNGSEKSTSSHVVFDGSGSAYAGEGYDFFKLPLFINLGGWIQTSALAQLARQ